MDGASINHETHCHPGFDGFGRHADAGGHRGLSGPVFGPQPDGQEPDRPAGGAVRALRPARGCRPGPGQRRAGQAGHRDRARRRRSAWTVDPFRRGGPDRSGHPSRRGPGHQRPPGQRGAGPHAAGDRSGQDHRPGQQGDPGHGRRDRDGNGAAQRGGDPARGQRTLRGAPVPGRTGPGPDPARGPHGIGRALPRQRPLRHLRG